MTPDSLSFAGMRAAMIDSQLRPQGIADPAVIAAFASIAREQFVPEGLRPIAYSDRAIPLVPGRSLTPPAALAQLVQSLAPVPGERALVVGAASGYSAAVLAAMGADVVALESVRELVAMARANGLDPIEGPLESGQPASGPYDCILIDGAVAEVPEAIVAQLADGGRLAAAIADRGVTRLVVGTKTGSAFGLLSFADAAVPVLPGFTQPPAFVF